MAGLCYTIQYITIFNHLLFTQQVRTCLCSSDTEFKCGPCLLSVHYRDINSPLRPLPWARWIQSITSHYFIRSILILSSHLPLGLPTGLFSSGFLIKILYACLITPIRATCPAHLFFLNLVKSTNYGAPHYAIFSSLLTLHPSCVQIFSSAPCSKTSSVCVLPLMYESKLHTHTKQTVEL
jgi:hypothetical protein